MPNTAPEPGYIAVAAAVIVDGTGRCLLSYRHSGQHQGDCWEFPGGKLEPGESAEQALRRELHEELGITAEIGPLLHQQQHRYSDKSVQLFFFQVERWRGEPTGREGQPLSWQHVAALKPEQFPAANRELVAQLQRAERLPSAARD